MMIGVSSKLMQGFPLEEILRLASITGFAGVEIWMHQVEDSGMSAAVIKKLAADLGLVLQVHMDTRDVNLTSSNKAIREASVSQALSAIDFSADLGSRIITAHPGRMTSGKELITRERLWELQIEAFAALSHLAEQRNVLVCVENMENEKGEFVLFESDVGRIIQSVGGVGLGVTLDVAHLASHNAGFAGNDTAQAVAAWKTPINNVHISQAGAKMHMPIFAENDTLIDYQKVFSLLTAKYSGMLIVEGYIKGQEKETLSRSFQWLCQFPDINIREAFLK